MSIHINIKARTPLDLRRQLSGILGGQVVAGPKATSASELPTEIGSPLQGGVYVGPLVEDGQLVHIIAACADSGQHEWKDAERVATEYRDGEFDDWKLPSKNELMLALMNAQDKFEKGYHWSGTPYGSDGAWAVGFERGDVTIGYRDDEFRVRPFRRFIP